MSYCTVCRCRVVLDMSLTTPTLTLKPRLPLTCGDHISTAMSIDRTMSTRQPLESDPFLALLWEVVWKCLVWCFVGFDSRHSRAFHNTIHVQGDAVLKRSTQVWQRSNRSTGEDVSDVYNPLGCQRTTFTNPPAQTLRMPNDHQFSIAISLSICSLFQQSAHSNKRYIVDADAVLHQQGRLAQLVRAWC